MSNLKEKLVAGLAVVAFALAVNGRSPHTAPATADDLFIHGSIPTIAIALSPDAVASLRDQPRSWVAATVHGGLNAQVRLKGHGSFRSIDDKPSLTVKFETSFLGLTKIHLNNSVEDSTYIQEKLGSEIFRENGIPAQRVGHARVMLNARNLGLYVLKEGFTREFFDDNFSSSKGDALESDRTVLGPDAESCGLSDDRFDVNALISMIATEVLICHWDGYATAGNNFRIYRDAQTGFHFIPTGMDQLFGNPEFPLNPDMTGAVARSLFATANGRQLFESRLRALSANFNGNYWAQRATVLASGLGPEVDAESVRELCERIIARGDFAERTLNTVAISTNPL